MLDIYRSRLIIAGYRPRTVSERLRCLTAFDQHCQPTATLNTATRQHVENFLARPLSPASRRCYLSHLTAYYTWLIEEGIRDDDPTAKLPKIRVKPGQPRPMPLADVQKALILATPRMRAWLLLMCLGGLRCIEVAALRPSDILTTDEGALLYLRECKGGGSATVPAHALVLDVLDALPVRNGLWWKLSAASISQAVRQYLRSIGIDATAHQLRHTAGSTWYRVSGHDLLVTAELLRHASVQSSQIYTATDPTRPIEVVRAVALPSAS